MTENYRLSFAPILVIYLRAIFGFESSHVIFSFYILSKSFTSKLIQIREYARYSTPNWIEGIPNVLEEFI
jgi:hypothetical protein